jgi:uncharacterized Zn-binding protein involved in type VI secretion
VRCQITTDIVDCRALRDTLESDEAIAVADEKIAELEAELRQFDDKPFGATIEVRYIPASKLTELELMAMASEGDDKSKSIEGIYRVGREFVRWGVAGVGLDGFDDPRDGDTVKHCGRKYLMASEAVVDLLERQNLLAAVAGEVRRFNRLDDVKKKD